MWAIKREKEKKHPPLLPYGTKLPHKPASVYACVVKEYKGSFADMERHSVKKVSDLIWGHILCRSESLMFVITIYHTKYVEPETSFRGDVDIHTTELTSVWHISISADMTLITIVKVYEIVLFPVVRVLAAFLSCTHRTATRVSLWDISLYVSISRVKIQLCTYTKKHKKI